MATLTTGVVLLRWQLLSAVMMFLASTLNIRFRRSDYVGLAVISSGLGVVSACWFAMGLLGITMADITAIWHNIESVMIEEMNAPEVTVKFDPVKARYVRFQGIQRNNRYGYSIYDANILVKQ